MVDAVEVGSGAAQSARCGACGQQQPLVADALAGGELEPAAGRIDGADSGRGVQLDVVSGVEARVVKVERVPVGLAAQIRLGQWRAVVGPLCLLAEQDQTAVEALGAQGLGRLGAGQAGPDDGEGGCGWHGSPRSGQPFRSWYR